MKDHQQLSKGTIFIFCNCACGNFIKYTSPPEVTILTPSGSLAKSMVDHKEDINFKITKFIRELENESDASDLVKEKAVQLLRECRQYLQNK